jgi:hypothetical protein
MGTKVTSSLTAVEIASLFGTMAFMSIKNASVYATSTFTKKVPVNREKTLFENSNIIAKTDVGYGTCFEPLLNDYQGEQYVVLITDGQQSDNIEGKWAKLSGKPNGAKLIVWHVVGYNNKVSNKNDVVYLKGYSDRILGVLKNIIEGKAGQLEEINKVKL